MRAAADGDVLDKFLALAGDREGGSPEQQLRALRWILLLYGATRSWLWVSLTSGFQQTTYVITGLGLSLSVLLLISPRTEFWAPRLALPWLGLLLYWSFPSTPNHFYLELLAVLLLSTVSRDNRQDERQALAALRWLTAIVLFQSGLQKVLHGCYFRGQFLAHLIGVDPRFAAFFGPLIGADEVARLASYNPVVQGAGPYQIDAIWFIGLANLVYVAELGLPLLLMVRRTRRLATIVALAFVVAFQLGAREVGFALLFGSLLLSYFPSVPLRPWSAIFGGLCLLALATAYGVLPGSTWLEALNP